MWRRWWISATNCRDNIEVTSRVCAVRGTHSNVFNRAICPAGVSNDLKRTSICVRRDIFHAATGKFFSELGFGNAAAVTAHCAGDPAITALACASSGQYARPFDTELCKDGAERAKICSGRVTVIVNGVSETNLPDGIHVDIHCNGDKTVTDLVCIPSGLHANLFDKGICPDSKAGNTMARAQACSDRIPTRWQCGQILHERLRKVTALICATTGNLANPFDLAICPDANVERIALCNARGTADDCTQNTAVTDVVCTDSGTYANPFNTNICTGDQTITQTAFLDNCKADTALGADCRTYTDCVANPYMDGCDATYYADEREVYTENLLTYCSNDRTGATAPVGAPDCATPVIQSDVCASSGTYANPLDAEVCPDGVIADLATIQSDFATTCYNARNDLGEQPRM